MKAEIVRRRNTAFTLIETLLVVGIIGTVAALALPNFVKARASSQRNACKENLRQIELAKESWTSEKRKTDGSAVVDSEVNTFLSGSIGPLCPGGGSYTYGNVGAIPTCSLGSSHGHTL